MLFKEKYMEMICVYIYTCFFRYDSLYVIYYMYICMYVYIYGNMLMFFFYRKDLGKPLGK